MPIHFDPALNHIVQAKCAEGCRAEVKKAAVRVLVTGDSDGITKGWKLADEMGVIPAEVTFTIVHINQAMLFFDKEPAEVSAIVSAMVPRVVSTVQTPDKVLVKMAATRLRKMLDMVEETNRQVGETNDRIAAGRQNGEQWALAASLYRTVPAISEIRTVSAMADTLETLGNARTTPGAS